ncbi:MAG: hypothetical protein HY901_33520 [Deltaproteobacteria bacterium]|nr:hypothetical protein [Deltaproteobacteria bacterium]
MRKLPSIIAGALVFGGLLTGRAMAQTPSPETSAPSTKAESISDPEKIQRSTEYLVQMRAGLKAVLGKLEEARASKDVVKLNCVNEKLTNIKGLLRISEQADIALQEAIAKKEGESSEHEYTKVVIARQKVDQLKAEAEQCVGMLAFETGPLEVIVEVPSDLPQIDPTQSPPPPPVVSRPPPASPTS